MNAPGAVSVDESGFIYVTDWVDKTVWVLDSTGRHVGNLGRPGEGPGEFTSAPGRVYFDGDSVGVLWTKGLTYFRRTGDYLDHKSIADAFTFALVLGRRSCLWTVMKARTLELVDICDSEVDRSVALAPRPTLIASNGSQHFASFLPRNMCASSGVRIYCGSNASDTIAVLSPDLDSLNVIAVPFKRIAITSAERRGLLDQFPIRRFPSLEIPDYWPAYEYMIADDRDRLWFSLWPTGTQSVTDFWIVNTHTGTVAKASVPGRVALWEINRGKAYGTEENESGVRTVVRYAISSPS